jgi:hypothetical protein
MSMKKKKHIALSLLALGAAVVIGGYVVTKQDQVAPQPAISDVQTDVLPTTPEPTQTVDEVVPPDGQTYRSIKVVTDQPGYEISREVGLANVPFVLSFNRMDEKHIQKNSTITIPPTFTDWDSLSPFPRELPVAQDIDKLLLVSQRIQAVGAYERGTLVRWMVTSTGKKETPTPSKLYFTNWKGKLVTSTLEGGYILPWAFNLDSMEGIAMHQFDLPGFPASHACVRLLEADAMWIYDWANQWILDASGQNELAKGTPVIIFGKYAYDKRAPWKNLATDPTATTLTVAELTEVLNKNINEIKAAAEKRVDVENQ